MFQPYPIAATANNWLHEAVLGIIKIIHARLDNGETIITTKEKQKHWKVLLPGNVDARLKGWTGVRDRILDYARHLKRANISQEQRADILQAIINQNNVVGLLNGTADISLIENDFPLVHEAAKVLFLFCYDKLGDAGVREAQYKIIYDSLKSKDCPFCGFGDMMNIAEMSQDQDHYLVKSVYAFSAANIRNLVPMCIKCNRGHKKTKNVIMNDAGERVISFDPYTCISTDICIKQSQIAENAAVITPDWQINFVPATPEAENWDRIFNIKERFSRDIFDECFDRWFTGFMNKCKRKRADGIFPALMSDVEIRNVLKEHRDSLLDDISAGKDKFKPHYFDMLLSLFDSGNTRVKSHVRDAVVLDEFR